MARPAGERGRALHCARCGALNSTHFNRCIRCGLLLAQAALPAERPRAGLDGRSLLATKILGGLTSFVFVGQILAAHAADIGPLSPWGMSNYVRFGAIDIGPGKPLELYRLLSAVFVHMGVVHFGMNMMTLGLLARAVEPAFGSARFAIAYVVTGLVGFATSAAWNIFVQPEPICTAGASGAVFGVMGLLLGGLLRRRDPRWKDLALQAALYIVLFGFVVNASNAGFRINNAAHIGGLLSGVLLGVLYAGGSRRFEGAANVGALAGVLACVAALVLAQRSPPWRAVESLEGRSRLDAPAREERLEARSHPDAGAPRPGPEGALVPAGS